MVLHGHFSWEIPFSFLAFQWTGIIYIYHRNQYIDQAAISLVFTIAIQEIFQTLVWMFGITSTTTSTECNLFNQIISHIIMLLLFLFPIIQLKFAYKTSFYNDLFRSDSIRKGSLKLIILFYELWYLLSMGLRVYNEWLNNEKLCIYLGENQQQDWSNIIYINALMKQHFGWKILIYFMNSFYLIPNILLFALYRPLWVIFCHASCTLGIFLCILCILYFLQFLECFSDFILEL